MTDPRPFPTPIIPNGAWAANEARKARGRATDETPHQAEDQQSQDRASRPDVPVGVMVVDGPPAERDEARKHPVNQPDRQVPHRLRHAVLAQWCMSMRYLSWHALQACSA